MAKIQNVARIDDLIEQRKHPDPITLAQEETPAQSLERRARLASQGMQDLRTALLVAGSDDVRGSVLDDLHGFFADSYFSSAAGEQLTEREKAARWSINLLWYAYLQAEGFALPVQVEVASAAPSGSGGSLHLDFGSGVGVTSQLFHALGYGVELADIEGGLLAFAQYRLERRGILARYIRLGSQPLPAGAYAAITAIDTLSFVPDFPITARALRAAMRAGGALFANFDTRRGVQIGWDILQHDDLWLRRRLQATGFEPEGKLAGGVRRYRAVDNEGVGHLARIARDTMLFSARRTYWATRARVPIRGG